MNKNLGRSKNCWTPFQSEPDTILLVSKPVHHKPLAPQIRNQLNGSKCILFL